MVIFHSYVNVYQRVLFMIIYHSTNHPSIHLQCFHMVPPKRTIRISASFRHRNLHVVSTGEEGAVEGGPPRQDLRAAHRPELLDPRKRRWPPVELPKYPGDVHWFVEKKDKNQRRKLVKMVSTCSNMLGFVWWYLVSLMYILVLATLHWGLHPIPAVKGSLGLD